MGKMEQIAGARAAQARRSLGTSASELVDVIKLLSEYRDISFALRPSAGDMFGMFDRADKREQKLLPSTRPEALATKISLQRTSTSICCMRMLKHMPVRQII